MFDAPLLSLLPFIVVDTAIALVIFEVLIRPIITAVRRRARTHG